MRRANPLPRARLIALATALGVLALAALALVLGTLTAGTRSATTPTDDPTGDAPPVTAGHGAPSMRARRATRTTLAPPPAEASPAAHIRRQQLAQRVGAMTLERAIAELPAYASGRRPDHARWLFQVSGLLLQHPAYAARLAEAAGGPDSGPRVQVMVADILAAVGHAPAQRALQGLVERSTVEAAVQHRLIQSHLQLAGPDAETVEWLADRLDHPTQGSAAVVAVGSVAGRLAARDAPRAEALVERLVDGLDRAGDAYGRRAHLLGLANAGALPDAATGAIMAQLGDPDPGVRQAAVAALSHLAGGADTAGRAALYGALDDREASVQRQAMAALGAAGLVEADIEPVLARLSAGGLSPAAQTAALHAAAAEATTDAAALALLSGLAEHGTVARVRERARVAFARRLAEAG